MIAHEKKAEEFFADNDAGLIQFISRMDSKDFIPIKVLTLNFRDFLNEDMDWDSERINTKWMGRAVKRLGLIKDKKRLGQVREIVLDIKRAKALSNSYGVVYDDE